MNTCPTCRKPTDLHLQRCKHCGCVLPYTVAEKFDLMAASIEQALKEELAVRRRRKQ